MPPCLADGGGEGPVPMARDRAGTASGHGAGGCSQDPAWVRGCRKLCPILRVGFVPLRSLLGMGRMQILVLVLPCWGPLCASGAVPIPGDTSWARLAHPCCVTGMPSSSPCFKQPRGEPRRHFHSCWGLLASKQTLPPTLSPRATASLRRHLPGAVGTVGTAGLRHPQHRSCTGPGASSSCPRELGCCPAHLCGRAGTRPRSPVWPAGRGERPPPSLGSADGGLFLCRAWTGTKPCSRE